MFGGIGGALGGMMGGGGSGVDVRMDYPKMREMAATYGTGAQSMHDAHEDIKSILGLLEEGAMEGEAAEQLKVAINVLINKMKNMEAKLRELQKDITGAVDKMEKGVAAAESRFHN